ncbi:hypothetical protein ACT17_34225 [Mycolicibacterium conceptionense]|uniref:Uncharacterized protein n=1 Tax=Mycolicibacterium conceptionense TaxID=451644 RepID=A0A0J8TVX2_9MYCO|nr:hypothetical protein [Mycolicibacterium conceptionense]KMV13611.1 hypothetical protein ACT17_34225 [Mycolicibacterium conceptionense]
MNMHDLAAAATANGWVEAAVDRDALFGDYRSASWRNASGDQILHAETVRSRERPNAISSIQVSTTDPLGWASTPIESWSEAEGNLDGAVTHLQQH